MERGLSKGLHKVKCRICKKEINYQGYKEHLKAQHPEEDSENMRDFNQPTLFGGMKRKKVAEDEEEKRKEEMEEEELEGEEKQREEKEEDQEREKDEGEDIEQEGGEIQKAAGELKMEAVEMSLDEKSEEDSAPGNIDVAEEEVEAVTEDEVVEVKSVNERLKQMLNNIESSVDDGSHKSEVDKLNNYLDIVEKRLEIKTDVNILVNKLEDLKMIQGDEKNIIHPSNVDADLLIKEARSMEEILEKVPVFEHHSGRQQVGCL